jgi:hypothetical protein
MFHTPAHKCDPRFPLAGTVEHRPYEFHPQAIVNVEPDIEVDAHGSIFTLLPLTAGGIAWCEEHIAHAMRWGFAYAVDHRYVQDIVDGMMADGLEVA